MLLLFIVGCSIVNLLKGAPKTEDAIPVNDVVVVDSVNAANDYFYKGTGSNYMTKTQILAQPGYSVSGSYSANQYVRIGDVTSYTPTTKVILTTVTNLAWSSNNRTYGFVLGDYGSATSTSSYAGINAAQGSLGYQFNSTSPASYDRPINFAYYVRGDFSNYSANITEIIVELRGFTSMDVAGQVALYASSTELSFTWDASSNGPTYAQISPYHEVTVTVKAYF